jgi:3-oxoacyl-[acyl-carrier-protein] synthase-3
VTCAQSSRASGSALPKRRVDNAELCEQVDTSDQWIVERTGIRSRYVAGDGETTASLATEAARKGARACRHRGGVDRADRARTATPDQTFPSSATKVQAALGINDCVAFDVHAVCTGFLYALTVADSMIRSGTAKRALVIGAETFSRILDWEDRATCVLFGDGAGALVLAAEEGESGVLATKLHADGRHNDLLFVDGGVSTTGTVGKLRMKGREVFRHAVVNLADVLGEVLGAAGLTPGDVDWWSRTRPTPAFSTQPRASSASRRRRSWSLSTSMPTPPPPRFRLRSTPRFAMDASSAATSLCSKRWAAALHGAPQRSDTEEIVAQFRSVRLPTRAVLR